MATASCRRGDRDRASVALQPILEGTHRVFDVCDRQHQVAIEDHPRAEAAAELVRQGVVALDLDAERLPLVNVADHLARLPPRAVPHALHRLEAAPLPLTLI